MVNINVNLCHAGQENLALQSSVARTTGGGAAIASGSSRAVGRGTGGEGFAFS